jgi:hypothetical protein
MRGFNKKAARPPGGIDEFRCPAPILHDLRGHDGFRYATPILHGYDVSCATTIFRYGWAVR